MIASIRLSGLIVAVTLMGGPAGSQELLLGYLDPGPILRAAAKAIGTSDLRCVAISGTAYAGMVGQQRLNGVESGLATRPTPDELHADHELGRRNHDRGVRS